MKLTDRNVSPSPEDPDAYRVTVSLQMEKEAEDLTFWFDVPTAYKAAISQTGNPWLILMLPIAIAVSEDISIPFPVDSRLLENVRGLMNVWQGWFPKLRPVDIRAPETSSHKSSTGRRGMFFSGGVDSFFTLLRHDKETKGCGDGPVDTLIFVGGFDIPLSARNEIVLARHRMQSIAAEFDKSLLHVTTNLRELDTPYQRNWILSHGCAMATVMHLLEDNFAEVLISSSRKYGHLVNIGTHPLTDPLLSSRQLRVVHDGASFSRTEKISYIGESEQALKSLRVCFQSKKHSNCSRCPKCLITMTAIDALGLSKKATSFDWSEYNPASIADLLLGNSAEVHRANELIEAARLRSRADLVAALQSAIDRSARITRAIEVVRRIPFLWRFDYQILQFLLRQF